MQQFNPEYIFDHARYCLGLPNSKEEVAKPGRAAYIETKQKILSICLQTAANALPPISVPSDIIEACTVIKTQST